MMLSLYNYKIKITRVIDGDTVEGIIELGFDTKITKKLRLLNINAPEMHGTTKETGIAAKEHLTKLLETYVSADGYHYIHTEKDDSFGRYLALIFTDILQTNTINNLMVQDNHAVAF